MRIYLYEDFDAEPQSVLRDIYRFLGVDDAFVADTSVRYNTSGVPRSKVVHTVLSKLQKATQATFDQAPLQATGIQAPLAGRVGKSSLIEKARRIGIGLKNRNLAKPRLAPVVRQQLLDGYRDDILALQELIQRDLSTWLIANRSHMEEL
jgi:hypothetical protein